MRLVEVALIVGTVGLGLALAFVGHRWSRLLLPLWAFALGLMLGGILVAVTFTERFLSTGTAWIVGGIVGAVLLILSLLYPALPGALLVGGVGASLAAAVVAAADATAAEPLTVAALLGGLGGAAVALALRSPRWLIVGGTAIAGASLTVAGLRLLREADADQHSLRAGPMAALLAGSPAWALLAVVVAAAGLAVQARLGPEVRPLPRLPRPRRD